MTQIKARVENTTLPSETAPQSPWTTNGGAGPVSCPARFGVSFGCKMNENNKRCSYFKEITIASTLALNCCLTYVNDYRRLSIEDNKLKQSAPSSPPQSLRFQTLAQLTPDLGVACFEKWGRYFSTSPRTNARHDSARNDPHYCFLVTPIFGGRPGKFGVLFLRNRKYPLRDALVAACAIPSRVLFVAATTDV